MIIFARLDDLHSTLSVSQVRHVLFHGMKFTLAQLDVLELFQAHGDSWHLIKRYFNFSPVSNFLEL